MRKRLRSGQRVYGTQVASLMTPTAARLVSEIGMDFAFFCNEHLPLDRSETAMMCQYYAARGISPIVRVPTPDAAAIGMALDAGAEGIVVPYLETVEQARLVAGAVRYRPVKGELLKQVLEDGQELPADTRRFLADFNRDKYLIIGIESVPAIDRLETLIAASDADGVFLGPHDITVSMGLPEAYTHPRFVDTIEDVVRRCRRCGVGVGLHMNLLALGEDILKRLLDAGMNWIVNGADIQVMCQAMREQLQRIRELANDDSAVDAEAAHEERRMQACFAPRTPEAGVKQ